MFNGLVNEKGCRNTNKPGDLKVEHTNLVWKEEAGKLQGQMTEKTLSRLSKSINLGEVVEEKVKLGVVEEDEEVRGRGDRVRVNRKNVFSDQIQKGVEAIEVLSCSV